MKKALWDEHRNITLFYLLTCFTSFWFMSSNWLYFWTKFMTFGQVGLVDGLGFGFSLLLDIPAGAIADLLGKKKTVVISFVASTIGSLLMASANSMNAILIGWLVAQFGISFYTGSMEALAYDTLVDLKEESRFQKIISNSQTILLITSAFAAVTGGYLYIMNERIPQYLWAFGLLLAFFTSFFLIEPKVEKIHFSLKNYVNQLSTGFKELFHPELRKYFVIFFVLLGVYYLYSWGLIRPAMADSFGFRVKEQGYIYAAMTLLSAGLIALIPQIRKRVSDFGGLIVFTLLIAGGFLIASFPVGKYGIFSLLLIFLGGETAYPWISNIVNHRISSKYRATTISTLSLISKIPYVLFAIVAGNAVQNGQLKEFSMGVTLVLFAGIAVSILIHFFSTKRDDLEVPELS